MYGHILNKYEEREDKIAINVPNSKDSPPRQSHCIYIGSQDLFSGRMPSAILN